MNIKCALSQWSDLNVIQIPNLFLLRNARSGCRHKTLLQYHMHQQKFQSLLVITENSTYWHIIPLYQY